MAPAPGDKIWPHLRKRMPRYGAPDAPTPVGGRPRLRRLLTVAALLVTLFAIYPVLHHETAVRRADGVLAVTQCDRLAADPDDTQKRAAGVVADQIDLPAATRACADAVNRHPHDGRLLYQAGRVARLAKDDRLSIDDFQQSAAVGYAQGQFTFAMILIRDHRTADDVCDGGKFLVLAARQPHLYARINLADLWRAGVFADCHLDVMESEVDALLKAAGELIDGPQEQQDFDEALHQWGTR
jgi:hypothetical protein